MTIFIKSIAFFALVSLIACSKNSNSKGPDEFLVIPTKPLIMPDNYSNIPLPILGMINRVQYEPRKDILRAFGGNPNLSASKKIKSNEIALLRVTTRRGVDQNIRKKLQTEDLALRKSHPLKVLERIAGKSNKSIAYKGSVLDIELELKRLRKLGIPVTTRPDD